LSGIYQNIGHIILMLLLLVFSAFFSGTETAYFNLSRRQINLLKKSGHRLQNLAAKITDNLQQLLGCLLFGNMAVNVLFFATASILVVKLEQQAGVSAATITAAVSFSVLVLIGEILPKSFAYANSRQLAIAVVLPLLLVLKVLSPVVSVFRTLIVEPVLRLILGPVVHHRRSRAVTADEFKSLVEHIKKEGLITAEEDRLLTEIIELGFLKVRDCLRPRVDMIACDVTDSNQQLRRLMEREHLTKVPVYAGAIDNIVGMVYFRQLLLAPDKSSDRLVQKVHFVPEQKSIESLLEFFRKTGTDTAIAVDEYGGIAGSICLEDIAEELLGPVKTAEKTEPIVQLGPFKYRLAGDLSIHSWANVFGVEPAAVRYSTIAGLVTALLGRIPRPGDAVRLQNLKFTVEQMQRHRIKTVILTLEAIGSNNG